MSKTYDGINIQWPISQDIISGLKSIETRTYPLPKSYLNEEIILVETPGKKGKFKARGIAIIKFTKSFAYRNKKEFYLDIDKHCVSKDSPWSWRDKPKWGWEVQVVRILKKPINIEQHGIVYRKNIKLT